MFIKVDKDRLLVDTCKFLLLTPLQRSSPPESTIQHTIFVMVKVSSRLKSSDSSLVLKVQNKVGALD